MYPSLERVKQIASQGDYGRIPVAMELLADRYTPVEIMRTLKAASRHCYLLESAENNQKWGRYSFMGYAPIMEITCNDGNLVIRKGAEDEEPEVITKQVDHPNNEIRNILSQFKSPVLEEMPPFTGGLVGYFSYDYIRYAEPVLKKTATPQTDFNDVDLMLFDRLIVFDHYKQKVVLIAGVGTEDIDKSYAEAEEALLEMKRLLQSGAKADIKPLRLAGPLTTENTKERFEEMVERAKKYIFEGDIFQVVLSNPISAPAKGSIFDAYRVLRTSNPSPYMFYFSSDDIEIAGASPETLANLKNGRVQTFPLAGTRPRGKDDAEDKALEENLLADEKERAEHNMLVDLGRNDIGRVSKLGTVNVDQYMEIVRFSHVMHIGSTVSGIIRDDCDALDAIDSILPAGTLSGAPKIRACQIIDELESSKRGIYGGAVGYLDFAGNMDTCIAIRLAYKKNNRVVVQSGAGIVADSIPENEHTECQNKAKAVIEAIKQAEGGLDQ